MLGPPQRCWPRSTAMARKRVVVGGAVRNALLGIPAPSDVDIATTALPDEVIRRAAAAGFRPVETGKEHGTITVVADGVPFEVTTLRQDVETYRAPRQGRVRPRLAAGCATT